MDSLTDRINRAELDLRALHEEARRLGITLKEVKRELSKEEESKSQVEKVETMSSAMSAAKSAAKSTAKSTAVTSNLEVTQAGEREEELNKVKAPVVEAREPDVTAQKPPSVTSTYSSNFEMELGRVWFVRLGIVLLTTGLVFLSSYTYKTWIHDLGPGVRLGLLYMVSFILTGVGLFCERWKESLRTYGRVVAAGGLAAVYYTSYAASNVTALKVIDSPVLGSILLLLTAVSCGGVSVWRNSRLMLGASVALAFYSLILNPVGWMVGVFAMVLSIGACVMGRARGWWELYFISLVGSYVSAGWWEMTNASLAAGSSGFLIVLWVLFAVMALFEKFEKHSVFCGLNHAAFAFLYSFDLNELSWMEGHWAFCLVFGVVLLLMGVLARRKMPSATVMVHLIKGVSFITLGIILKLSGHVLFLTLLFEAVILSTMQLRVRHSLVKVGSLAVAGMGAIASAHFGGGAPPIAWVCAALLWGAIGVLQRLADESEKEKTHHNVGLICWICFFVSMVFGGAQNLNPDAVALSLGGVGLLISVLLQRKVLLRYFADFYLIGQGVFLVALSALVLFSEKPGFLLMGAGFTMAASFLHRQMWLSGTDERVRKVEKEFAVAHYGLGIILLVVAAHFGISNEPTRMVLAMALPFAGVLVARKTHWEIHAILPFVAYALVPAVFVFEKGALFLSLGVLIAQLVVLKKSDTLKMNPLLEGLSFLIAATFGFFAIASLIVETEELVVLMAWIGVGMLLLERFYKRALVVLCAVPFLIAGFGGSWILRIFQDGHVMLPYVALIPMIGIHLWSSFTECSSRHRLLGVASLISLWSVMSADVGAENHSANWAVLGTISLLTGLLFKSRQFRLVALIVLISSLGHVMFVDLIKLDPLPRILSFITLGVGLLGLGFVYNRWQDKLKGIL